MDFVRHTKLTCTCLRVLFTSSVQVKEVVCVLMSSYDSSAGQHRGAAAFISNKCKSFLITADIMHICALNTLFNVFDLGQNDVDVQTGKVHHLHHKVESKQETRGGRLQCFDYLNLPVFLASAYNFLLMNSSMAASLLALWIEPTACPPPKALALTLAPPPPPGALC